MTGINRADTASGILIEALGTLDDDFVVDLVEDLAFGNARDLGYVDVEDAEFVSGDDLGVALARNQVLDEDPIFA